MKQSISKKYEKILKAYEKDEKFVSWAEDFAHEMAGCYDSIGATKESFDENVDNCEYICYCILRGGGLV